MGLIYSIVLVPGLGTSARPKLDPDYVITKAKLDPELILLIWLHFG